MRVRLRACTPACVCVCVCVCVPAFVQSLHVQAAAFEELKPVFQRDTYDVVGLRVCVCACERACGRVRVSLRVLSRCDAYLTAHLGLPTYSLPLFLRSSIPH